MGKVVNQVMNHSRSIWAWFWGKRWKTCKMTKIGYFELNLRHFGGKNCHCGSFWATSMWNNLQKLKTQRNCWCTPPRMKIFEISPKMRCFGGKRWEKLWNWPFQVNLSLILGEKMEKDAKWPKLAILSQSKPLFWQNLPLCVIWATSVWNDLKKVEEISNKYAISVDHSTALLAETKNFDHFSKNEKLFWRFGKRWEKILLRY